MTRDIPASVRGRLENLARQSGRPLQELMQYFVIERFLFRLSQAEYADRFVLKGALMFTPHSEQSPIVEQLFELASQAIKPSELADHANSSQWRNHQNETGRWTPRWITKLLKNRVYIGEIKNEVSFLPGQHLPIVSSTVFDTVQHQLANRIVRGSSGWKRELIKPSTDELELLGILYCGQCDRPMSTSVSPPEPKEEQDR